MANSLTDLSAVRCVIARSMSCSSFRIFSASVSAGFSLRALAAAVSRLSLACAGAAASAGSAAAASGSEPSGSGAAPPSSGASSAPASFRSCAR